MRREIFTTPKLVTTQRSILGPPAEGRPGPSKNKFSDKNMFKISYYPKFKGLSRPQLLVKDEQKAEFHEKDISCLVSMLCNASTARGGNVCHPLEILPGN